MSVVLSARRFQILFQSILLKPCNTGIATPISQMRKLKLGDSKLLVQDHRAYKWQSREDGILCRSQDVTLPLLSCSQGSSSRGSTVLGSHLCVSSSVAS